MTKASVYEILDPLSTIRKQRFWGWLDGTDIRAIWNKSDGAGTGVFSMVDALNEGFQIQAGASVNNTSNINFNNIRHYSNVDSTLISIFRRVTTTTLSQVGLFSTITSTVGDRAFVRNDTINTFYTLTTANAGTASTLDSSIAIDTTFRTHEIVLSASDCILSINGVLEVTKTTDLPSGKMQPRSDVFSRANGTRQTRIRYLEAYNI